MTPVYLWLFLGAMLSNASASVDLTGPVFSFYSVPDTDGETHQVAEVYGANSPTEPIGCLMKSIYDEDHGALGSIHINQVAHWAVHEDESYCIITYTGTCHSVMCARTWNTADDGDFFVEHPIYDRPDSAVVIKGACDEGYSSFAPPPDEVLPKDP